MSKDLLKLPILTLVGGIILRVIGFIIAFILAKMTNEWTPEMSTILFYIRFIISIIEFAIIGTILRKANGRNVIFKSATLLVIYSITVFILEQAVQYLVSYNMIINFLFLPIELFTIITSILAGLTTGESISWIHVIPSLFAPYLFVMFGKESVRND